MNTSRASVNSIMMTGGDEEEFNDDDWEETNETMPLELPEEDDSRQSFEADDSCSQSLSQLSWKSDDYQKVEDVVEYEWPPGSGQNYFIEENLADYLEIKFLRRFYPTLERRRIQTLDEREFLLEKGFVNALQCDLGLIVISAEQVYKHIAPDHVQKFDIYNDLLWQKNYGKTVSASLNSNSVNCQMMAAEELRTAATKSCASWNAKKNNETARDNNRFKRLKRSDPDPSRLQRESYDNDEREKLKIDFFPLAVTPGQFVNYPEWFERVSSELLVHFPVETILHGPYTPTTTNRKYSLLMKEADLKGRGTDLTLQFEDESNCNHRSPSECSTDTDSASTSSSTLTCSFSELDSDFNGSICDSF